MANNSFTIRIEDHSGDILKELEKRASAALEACGKQAVSHAKAIITRGVPRNPDSWYVPTGVLRNSINHEVVDSENTCYIGTNTEYAIYNEFGTGIYLESDDGRTGRQTPWMYRGSDGQMHITRGMKPLHMLKNALANNIPEYKKIMEDELKK